MCVLYISSDVSLPSEDISALISTSVLCKRQKHFWFPLDTEGLLILHSFVSEQGKFVPGVAGWCPLPVNGTLIPLGNSS